MARRSLYYISFWNFLILGLWIMAMLLIFHPYGMTDNEADSQQDHPNIGSLAIEQLGSKLRISFVSYSPFLELILPGLQPHNEYQPPSPITPSWFLNSFAATPMITAEGPCEFDLPGWDYKSARLSMQVIAYCPASLQSWQWDLSFLLGPLSHGRVQVILVDDESSEVVELSGRHLRFKTRRLNVAASDFGDEQQDQDAG